MHYLVLTIAIGFWISAFVISWRQIHFLLNSTTTMATFIDWIPQRSRNSTLWYAQVSFSSPDGMEHQCLVGFGHSPKPAKPPRATIVVRYAPDKPESAQSASWLHYWAGPVVFFGFAFTMTAIFLNQLKHGA